MPNPKGTWVKGQSGNPLGRRQEKPFRDALRIEIAAAGGDLKKLREIAKRLISIACEAEDHIAIQAIKELADRLDGRVPQAVIAEDEDGLPTRHWVTWIRDVDTNGYRLPDDERDAGGKVS